MDISKKPSNSKIKKCLKDAACFRPCVNGYKSCDDAIMDIYINNFTNHKWRLNFEENVVSTGPFAIERKAKWIIPPPKYIKPRETVVMRAYSDKISTSDPNICAFNVNFTVTVIYKNVKTGKKFELVTFTIRPGSPDACMNLLPFEPIVVATFETNAEDTNILVVFPPCTEPIEIDDNVFEPCKFEDWRNTAYFVLS
jgi:hypothetical protein